MAAALGREEKEVFAAYLVKNRLKRSEQREVILDAFLRSERHLSVDDLLRIVQKRRPDIGRTTVYRTLKLLAVGGTRERARPATGRPASSSSTSVPTTTTSSASRAATIFEFSSPEIERIQDEIAAGIGFVIDGHRHQIFGFCRRCVAQAPRPAELGRRPPPMKLERIEVRHVRLPLRFPFETSFGRTTAKEFLLVAVSADGRHRLRRVRGRRGPLLPARDERHRPPRAARLPGAPGLLGCEIGHPRELLAAFARVRGHEMAKAALEMAVLGARGAPAQGRRSTASSADAAATIVSGVSVGLQKDVAALLEKVEAEVAAGLPTDQDQDQARPRPRAGGGDSRALPRRCP